MASAAISSKLSAIAIRLVISLIECAAGADVVGRLLDGVGEPARARQRLPPIENSGPTAIKAQPSPRIGLDLIAARLAAADRS